MTSLSLAQGSGLFLYYGHDKGEVASQVVGSAICECWEQASSERGVKSVLREAFRQASEALDAKADMLSHVDILWERYYHSDS